MKVCIFGGTFDPVHNGHIKVAETAIRTLNVDRLIWLPTRTPPYKSTVASPMERLEMVRRAAQTVNGSIASDLEIRRDGLTYTVDTMRVFREIYPCEKLYFIIGSDVLSTLEKWKGIDEIAKMCVFAVIPRADFEWNGELPLKGKAEFVILPPSEADVSSQMIREMVAKGETIKENVPECVEAYIRDKGLYISRYSKEALTGKLRSVLKPGRYDHTLGVADTAVRLARKYGSDPRRAEYAALLHDCAKSIPSDELRKMIIESGIETDAEELTADNVLHAPAGAIIAEKEYGIKDSSILSAIRKHTIGDPRMSLLDAIIYTADYIEPGRKPFKGLDDVRKCAEEDIEAAMVMCAEKTAAYVLANGGVPHPKSLKLIENYKRRTDKRR